MDEKQKEQVQEITERTEEPRSGGPTFSFYFFVFCFFARCADVFVLMFLCYILS